MGGKSSKGTRRHNSNRVFATNDSAENAKNLDSANELEEIRVPDTTKHKPKSISLFAPFSKKSSFHKTSSLQSAVQGQKLPESLASTLQRENEDLRKEIKKLEERYLEENKHHNNEIMHLKTEMKLLNSALRRARSDKDNALRTEKDAVERANNFELEKEKIQQAYKQFRETKEEEINNLIKEKLALQNQLRRLIGNEGSINEILLEGGDIRHSKLVNEWLLGQSGQSGTESMIGQQVEDKWIVAQCKKTKEVCKAFRLVLNSVQYVGYGVPTDNVYSIYVTSPKALKPIADILMTQCRRLQLYLENEERLLTLSYFVTLLNSSLDKIETQTREEVLSKADVVIVLIDQESKDMDASAEMIWKAINLNKNCFVASLQEVSAESLLFLSNGLQNYPKLKLIHGNGGKDELVSTCYDQLVTICKMFHDRQLDREQFTIFYDDSIKPNEDVFKSWDMLGIEEQLALHASFKTEHFANDTFVKEMQELDHYLTQDGQVMPLLIKGTSGCGKSTLLSNWITSIEDSLPNSCILYHVADLQSPYSLDPIHILRRFLVMLLDQLPMFSSMNELGKEFPGWLDRACSKYRNGVVIVIDGVDLIDGYKEHFKWLINPDPLPVPVRVIISLSNENTSEPWNGWQTLELRCSIENTLRVCQYHLEEFEHRLTGVAKDFIQQMLQSESAIESLSVHLYRHLVFTLLSWTTSDGESRNIIGHLTNTKHFSDIYILVLQMMVSRHNENLVQSVLCFVYLSSNGLSLAELQELHDCDHGLMPLLYDLKESELIQIVAGMVKIHHSVGFMAIEQFFQISKHSNDTRVVAFRVRLVELFESKFLLNCTSYRVADELPAQLVCLKDTEKLMTCMSSIFIFVHLYRRGRYSAIIEYWNYLGKDLKDIQEIYTAALVDIQDKGGFDGQILMLYDIIGSFFRDIGEYLIAQKFLERSLELKEEHLEPDDLLLRRSHYILAKLYTQLKKFPSAEDCLKQALEVKNLSNDSEPTVATILDFLSSICMLQEKAKEADMYRKNAASMKETIFVQHELVNVKKNLMECNQLINVIYETRENINLDQITSWLVNISYVYFNTKQYPEAADVLQQALKYLSSDAESTSNNQAVADIMHKLSFVYTTVGQNDKAEAMLESALNTYFKLNLLEEPNLMVVYNSLVKLYKSQKRMDSLERLHRQHCEAMEKAYGSSDIRVASVVNDLAVHLSKMGKLDEAFKLYQRAMRIYVKAVGFQDERVSDVLKNLAKLMQGERKTELAAYYYTLSRDPNRKIDQLKNFISKEVQ